MGLDIAMFPTVEVTGVACTDESPCSVELADGYRLNVACWWRLLDLRRIVATSYDGSDDSDGTLEPWSISKLRDAISGQRITDVRIADRTADLTLVIGPWTFEALNDSSRHEAWHLWRGDNLVLAGFGGGQRFAF